MLRSVFLFTCTVVVVVISSGNVEEVVNDHRIINGQDANIEDFPYTLLLYSTSYLPAMMVCGAVIISRDWCLTAAHCVVGSDEQGLHLHTNSTNIVGTQGREHGVSKKIVHPLYKEDPVGGNVDYDVALLKVDPPFVLGTGTLPVDLPDQDEIFAAGLNGTVTGWGTKGDHPIGPSTTLQKTTLLVTDQEQCVTLFANAPIPTRGVVTARMICAQGFGSGCMGDSGGPFVVGNRLVGVVSWGSVHCVDYPNVFTRVSFFRDWVREQAGV